MVGRRATAAGIATRLGNHSFRATGITAYLKNGGTLEKAAQMANHASTRTTQLYDRRREELSLDARWSGLGCDHTDAGTRQIIGGRANILSVGQRVGGKSHRSERRRIQLPIRLQSTTLLELLDGVLGAPAPDAIHSAGIEAQAMQARLDDSNR
jgi:hypothetical protein